MRMCSRDLCTCPYMEYWYRSTSPLLYVYDAKIVERPHLALARVTLSALGERALLFRNRLWRRWEQYVMFKG